MNFAKTYEDCYVSFDGSNLTIGNNRIERSWEMKGEVPRSLSFRNKRMEKEWFSDPTPAGWLSVGKSASAGETIPNSGKASGTAEEPMDCTITTHTDDDFGFAVPHFVIDVELEYHSWKAIWRHIIYPGLPILRNSIILEKKSPIASDHCAGSRGKQERPGIAGMYETLFEKESNGEGYIDVLPGLPIHCKWKSVCFQDATDHHNNLVSSQEGLLYSNEKSHLSGNLLFVKDSMHEDGFLAVKEGPTPVAYQGGVTHDFEICGNNILTSGGGISAEEWRKAQTMTTYGSAVVLWEGDGEDAILALQQYHRAIHRYNPERDAFVMCNTWGDRSKSVIINEDFMRKELSLAESLRISCYQIDAGWQEGVSTVSAQGGIEGYYRSNPNYWHVNGKGFPKGLQPVAEQAKSGNMDLGLWFSPDSLDDFCNWRKDADTLVNLYREYGIKAFKLDAIHIRSKKGEENLFRMMREVTEETDGKVILNLDVTAQTRNGYYGRVQYASLFLENRYTDWHNYYPHWTLRNLWMLSGYYPTFRLQTEFLNVNRNRELYSGDALAPSVCGMEYAFAVTMFSNPLAWMTLTGLDKASRNTLERMIPIYRNYQSDILSGIVLPIGEEPSGTGWTGFQSITGDGKGYLLILKERNDGERHSYALWKMKDREIKLHRLMGQGEDRMAKTDGAGRMEFCLTGNFQYALYAYEKVTES